MTTKTHKVVLILLATVGLAGLFGLSISLLPLPSLATTLVSFIGGGAIGFGGGQLALRANEGKL